MCKQGDKPIRSTWLGIGAMEMRLPACLVSFAVTYQTLLLSDFNFKLLLLLMPFAISLLLHLSRALSSPRLRARLLPIHLTAIDVGAFFWNPPCLTDSRSECSTTSARADVVRQALAGRHHHGPSMSPSEYPISLLTAQVSQCASIHA